MVEIEKRKMERFDLELTAYLSVVDKIEKRQVTMRLEPLEQPSCREAQEQFCRKLTALGAQTPAGMSLVLEVGDFPL